MTVLLLFLHPFAIRVDLRKYKRSFATEYCLFSHKRLIREKTSPKIILIFKCFNEMSTSVIF